MDRDQYRPSPTALKLKAVTGFLLGGLGALVESVLEPWKLNIKCNMLKRYHDVELG